MDIWPDIQSKCLVVPSLPKIAIGICLANDANLSDVRGKSRKAELVEIRNDIAENALRHKYTLEEIGEYLNRDHSTIQKNLTKRRYNQP